MFPKIIANRSFGNGKNRKINEEEIENRIIIFICVFSRSFFYSFTNNKAKIKITQYQKSQRIKGESYCIYTSLWCSQAKLCDIVYVLTWAHSSLTKLCSPKEIIWYYISLRNHIVIVVEYDHFLFFVDLFVQTCGYKKYILPPTSS